MIPAELSEALIEGLGDDVVVMVSGSEDSVEEGLQIEPGAHTPQFEVAEPQFGMGEPSLLAIAIEQIERRLSHRVPLSGPGSGLLVGTLTERQDSAGTSVDARPALHVHSRPWVPASLSSGHPCGFETGSGSISG
jgi:hypothetical protein